MPPNIADTFHRKGWSKSDVRNYLVENSKQSIASLKRMTAWGRDVADFPGFAGDPKTQKIEPGDEQKYVYLFRENPEYDRILFGPSSIARKMDIYIAVTGGYRGAYMWALSAYPLSTEPVSRRINMR